MERGTLVLLYGRREFKAGCCQKDFDVVLEVFVVKKDWLYRNEPPRRAFGKAPLGPLDFKALSDDDGFQCRG